MNFDILYDSGFNYYRCYFDDFDIYKWLPKMRFSVVLHHNLIVYLRHNDFDLENILASIFEWRFYYLWFLFDNEISLMFINLRIFWRVRHVIEFYYNFLCWFSSTVGNYTICMILGKISGFKCFRIILITLIYGRLYSLLLANHY